MCAAEFDLRASEGNGHLDELKIGFFRHTDWARGENELAIDAGSAPGLVAGMRVLCQNRTVGLIRVGASSCFRARFWRIVQSRCENGFSLGFLALAFVSARSILASRAFVAGIADPRGNTRASSQQATAADRSPGKGHGIYSSSRSLSKGENSRPNSFSLTWSGFFYGILVLWLVLRWKLAAQVSRLGGTFFYESLVQAFVFTPPLILTIALLESPTAIYEHIVSRKYGLSVEGWGALAWDWTKACSS